jgi:hypothetical protein
MAKDDITHSIEALRTVAVGRCRERIEQAARKAKGLFKNGEQEEQKIMPPADNEEKYGVTSLLKRKHGL